MANPYGTRHQDASTSSFNGAHPASNDGSSVPESSDTVLKHNPGISAEWSAEEQAILEDGLSQYASESNINRYAKIAIKLQNKTVRDVALRCRWMSKKENSKRRKEENMGRKSKDKKERATDPSGRPSPFTNQLHVPPYANSPFPTEYEDGISYKAIGGITGELLEQNALLFSRISTNLSTMQTHENIDLLLQARDNILQIMNDLNNIPEIMRQMPRLPVRLNEELASTILPRPNLPMK